MANQSPKQGYLQGNLISSLGYAVKMFFFILVTVLFSNPVFAQYRSQDFIPPTVRIVAPVAGSSVAGVSTLVAHASDNVRIYSVRFAVDNVTVGEVRIPPYQLNLDTTTLSSGSHTLRVTARDIYGNQTSSQVSFVVSSDNSAPSVAMVAPVNEASVSGIINVEASASDNVGVVGVQFQWDEVNIGAEDTLSPYELAINTVTSPNGIHRIRAIARDAAGNKTISSAVSVEVKNADTIKPELSLLAPKNGETLSGAFILKASAGDNSSIKTVQFWVDGKLLQGPISRSGTSFSAMLDTTKLTNGAHALTVMAYDSAGNSNGVTVNVEVKNTIASPPPVDITPPSITLTTPLDKSTVSGTITVTANASDNIGVAGVQFMFDGVKVGVEDTTPPYSLGIDTSTTSNDTHTLTAIARDAAGNKTTSAPISITVNNPDTIKPVVNVITPKNGEKVQGALVISAEASDNKSIKTIQFWMDGKLVATPISKNSASLFNTSVDTTKLANGAHAVTVMAYDGAGNSSNASLRIIVNNPLAVSPSVPANLSARAVSSSQINLSWSASTHSLGVSGYKVFRNGAQIAIVTTTNYSNTGLNANTSYTYAVAAYDAAGNTSSLSASASATTLANNAPPPSSVLRVGPGQQYATPSQAAAAAQHGDTIEISAGLYTKDATIWTKDNLVIRGVGGRPHIRSDGTLAGGGAGLWVVQGNNTTIENVELSGARSDGAGSGIRLQGNGLVLRDCFIHHNEHGILTNNQGLNRTSDVLIERCEFANNGSSDGQAHNIYIGEIRSFTLRNSYSHDSLGGQLVKSRALTNYILYNRLVDSTNGHSNYELDLSCGGIAYVIGNTLYQTPATQNSVMFTFNPEGTLHSCPTRQLYTHELYLINNTFINTYNPGYFVQLRGTLAAQKIHNNLFAGDGFFLQNGSSSFTPSADNLRIAIAQAGFLDATSQNYRLLSTSPAIDRGINPGNGSLLALTPVEQYVHPASRQERTIKGGALDAGAYEFGISAPQITQPLSAPTLGGGVAGTTIRLSWSSVFNESGPVHYKIYRNDALMTTVQALSWTDTAPPTGPNTYTVRAESAGAQSALSNAITIAVPRIISSLPIPTEPGWYELANTKMRSVCFQPAPPGVEGCSAVIDDWNSGAFDTKRNRLLLWGGGHAGYYGNEFYALNLDTLKMERVNSPGLPVTECLDTVANGTQPSARHTYDGITYLANVDRFLSIGGIVACGARGGGNFSPTAIWSFDLASMQWHKPALKSIPTDLNPAVFNSVELLSSAYDPKSGLVWFSNGSCLFSYDPSTDTVTRRTQGSSLCRPRSDAYSNHAFTSVIDPVRNQMLLFGLGEGWKFDLNPGSTYTPTRFPTSGGDGVIGKGYPGLAWDPVSERVVGWGGGDTVYLLDPETRIWTTQVFPGGPGARNPNGTYKRFAYSPKDDVFVVVNHVDRNAFVLRLDRHASNSASDTILPTISITAPAHNATVSSIMTASANAADNIGVVGVQFKFDGINVGAEDTSAPYSLQIDTTTTTNGSHTLTAVARDAAGNKTTSSPVTITVNNPDTLKPTVSLISPKNGESINGVFSLRADATDNISIKTIQLWIDGKLANEPINKTGTSSFATNLDTTKLANGAHSLTVVVYDSAGNTNSATVGIMVNNSVDTTAPSVSLTYPTHNAVISGSVTISANAADNKGVLGVQFKIDGVNVGGEDAVAPYSITWNSKTVANGPHTLTATARDATGNQTTSTAVTVTVNNSILTGTSAIGSAPGWYEIPNTKLRQVDPCPTKVGCPWSGVEGQNGVISGPGSGAYDTKRNRLIMWGGGHAGYFGNELYALNFDNYTVERLTEPGLPLKDRYDAIANGTQPSSRHTYDGIGYLPPTDEFVSFGGVISFQSGEPLEGQKNWAYSFATRSWRKLTSTPAFPFTGTVSSYDPVTQEMLIADLSCVYGYNPSTEAVVVRSKRPCPHTGAFGPGNGFWTSIIDPVRRHFYIIGNGDMLRADISATGDYIPRPLVTTGANSIIKNTFPGLTYDSKRGRIVAWANGNTVYDFNPDTKVWTAMTFPGGAGNRAAYGTYKRFTYVPKDDVFVVVNDVDRNAFAFRLGDTLTEQQPPSPPSNLQAAVISQFQINLSWPAATDNIQVNGYHLYRNGTQIASVSSGTSYQDMNLNAGTTYTYTVKAFDLAGNVSASSPSVQATTYTADTIPPSVPGNLTASGIKEFQATLSWSAASDNFSVTGYKIYRGGTQIATITSGTTYQDIPLNPGTAYTYQVRAYDLTGNLSTPATVSLTTLPVPASAQADFAARCAAAGVVSCQGFETPLNTHPDVYIKGSSAGFQPELDPLQKASGLNSLRIAIPGKSAAGGGGAVLVPFNKSFAQQSEFYVQWRQRFSPEMLNIPWGSLFNSSWKQVIIFGPAGSCANQEVTFVTSSILSSRPGMPTGYIQCGYHGLYTTLDGSRQTDGPPLLIQQGDHRCAFNEYADCARYAPNTWMTFSVRVRIGTWGKPDSLVEAWVGVDGQPWKQFLKVPGLTLNHDGNPQHGFTRMLLTPYMTGKNPAIDHATAYTWYDDVIVSEKPIPPPAANRSK